MKKLNIEQLAKLVRPKRTIINAIEKTCVRDGVRYDTDLEFYLAMPEETQQSGMYLNGLHVGKDTDRFPELPQGESTPLGVIEATDLITIAGFEKFASTDELQPALTCINFSSFNGSLCVVSTDGHRLRYKHFDDTRFYIDQDKSLLLPSRVGKMLGLIGKAGFSTSVALLTTPDLQEYVGFKFDNDKFLYVKTVESIYPRYRRIVPDPSSLEKMLVPKTDETMTFLKDIKKVQNGIKKSEKTWQVDMQFSFDNVTAYWYNIEHDLEMHTDAIMTITSALAGKVSTSDYALLMPIRISEEYKDMYNTAYNSEYLITCLGDFSSPVIFLSNNSAPTIICNK